MNSLILSRDFTPKSSLVYELISSFVLHVLYARGVLPEPFEGLHSELLADGAQQPEKLKYSDRKKRKSVEDIVEMLDAIRLISGDFCIERVAVLLGPSANNPKETYTIDICPLESSSQEDSLSTRQVNQSKRHLIHKLIEHQATEECPPSSRANAFLAIQIAEGSISDIDEHLQDAFKLFGFRDSFKVKSSAVESSGVVKKAFGGRRKAKPFHLHVVSKGYEIATSFTNNNDVENSSSLGELPLMAPAQVDENEPRGSGTWLVLCKGIKNIPA